MRKNIVIFYSPKGKTKMYMVTKYYFFFNFLYLSLSHANAHTHKIMHTWTVSSDYHLRNTVVRVCLHFLINITSKVHNTDTSVIFNMQMFHIEFVADMILIYKILHSIKP